jgi:hypothetical protein
VENGERRRVVDRTTGIVCDRGAAVVGWGSRGSRRGRPSAKWRTKFFSYVHFFRSTSLVPVRCYGLFKFCNMKIYGINVHIILFLRLKKIHDVNFYITMSKWAQHIALKKFQLRWPCMYRHNVNKHLAWTTFCIQENVH